jgi:urocanate hydratase
MYRELLDNYPGVTFVSDSNLDLGDWSPQEYALYSETTVPPNRTRTFQITKALDMLAYDGTLHVQCPVGVFKTSNTSIQRVLAYVALTNPNVTLLTDVATT